ncbi:bifunctional 4-hydroxy-2-oxoglutarate aldolase/2-dehydro-3-deoxy-phosphogluconate aldolase [Bacillus sp. AL-1R]
MGVYEIKKRGIVAVIRNATIETIIPIAQALKIGGVTALEITMETPKAIQIIDALRTEFSEELLVGAGTVLDPETARAAIMSGAQFVFSPTVNVKTINMAKRYGVISVPGAMTPTEILTAFEAGADIVKVFPAHILGAEYMKALSGPLSHIPLMPTGGIDLDNVQKFIKSGAIAVGIGSTLVNTKKEVNSEYLFHLTETARSFTEKVTEARKVLLNG